MRTFSDWCGQQLQRLRRLTALCLLILVLSWTLPATAASRISPKLEENVLQIIRQHPEAILESLQAYQQQQQQVVQQIRQVFLQDLKTNPQAVIGESPSTGATSAKIVLVEFSDYQCPYCAEAHKNLKQILAKNPDKFTLVYKHFPLASIHNQAIPAAKAAWAAQQQGKFWEYHDALFTNQNKLGEDLYKEIATNLNLDLPKFEQDRNNAEAAIRKDLQLAESLRLSGTPFFVLNSENFSGAVQLADLEKIFAQIATK